MWLPFAIGAETNRENKTRTTWKNKKNTRKQSKGSRSNIQTDIIYSIGQCKEIYFFHR